MPSRRSRAEAAISLIGKLWTLPNTLLGLAIGVLALPFGARLALGDNAILFTRVPVGAGGALVLGNVILLTTESLDVAVRSYRGRLRGIRLARIRLGDHERAHTYQYEVLGPLFLPVYLWLGWRAGGVISAHNPFEAAADRYALTGKGWWPSRRRLPHIKALPARYT